MRTKGTDVVVVTAKEPMSCRQKVTPRSWKKRETGKLLQLLLLLLLQSGPKVGQGWNTTKEKRDFFLETKKNRIRSRSRSAEATAFTFLAERLLKSDFFPPVLCSRLK